MGRNNPSKLISHELSGRSGPSCPWIAKLSLVKDWLFVPNSRVFSGSRNICQCKSEQCQAIEISFSWSRSSNDIDFLLYRALLLTSYESFFPLHPRQSLLLAPSQTSSSRTESISCCLVLPWLPGYCTHRRWFIDIDWVNDVLLRNHIDFSMLSQTSLLQVLCSSSLDHFSFLFLSVTTFSAPWGSSSCKLD